MQRIRIDVSELYEVKHFIVINQNFKHDHNKQLICSMTKLSRVSNKMGYSMRYGAAR